MAHQIETMAYAHETPWHGLGARVADCITVDEMRGAAGLNWSVERRPLMAERSEKRGFDIPVPDHFALVRSSDARVLDVVGAKYQIHQPADVMEFFRDFCSAGGATLETAGSLRSGRVIWCLADLRQSFRMAGGDEVRGYLLLAAPYRSGEATVARLTATRVVCANTLAMAMSGTAALERRWSHALEFDPVAAGESLGLVRDNFGEFERNVRLLKKLRLTDAEAMRILAPAYQPGGCEGVEGYPEAADALTAREELRNPTLTKVLEAYRSAPGAEPGTGWGALNAATYYADHVARRDRDARLTSAWLGTEARRKTAVFRSLLELAS